MHQSGIIHILHSEGLKLIFERQPRQNLNPDHSPPQFPVAFWGKPEKFSWFSTKMRIHVSRREDNAPHSTCPLLPRSTCPLLPRTHTNL